ncbi:MAG: tRNA uracil 4-sulfurtransferase ThiI [Acidilobaceae archaeon]
MEYNSLIVRYGEVGVKGRTTRRRGENAIATALKESFRRRGVEGQVMITSGRIIVWRPSSIEAAAEAARRVFGVRSVSPSFSFELRGLAELAETVGELLEESVVGKRFTVRAKRVGEHDFSSRDVERAVGAELIRRGAREVDMEGAEVRVFLEIRGEKVFLYDRTIEGMGGMPPATEGTLLVLLSGGFDSAVAAWRLMRRGAKVHLVHYDLGSPYATKTAVEVARRLAEWSLNYKMKMYLVDFRGIVSLISSLVSPPYRVLVVRRLMMEHAARLAERLGAEAIATGESVGQVSSQTLRNMRLTSAGLRVSVIRPLAGHDKEEILREAKMIGTYELSERQIETCGAIMAVPHANERAFWREYERVSSLPLPEPAEVELSSELEVAH